MTADKLAILIAVIGAGSYFQTVTGFSLDDRDGRDKRLQPAPLATVATLMSVVSLANGATALPGRLHHIDWRAVGAATLGILPSVVAGVLLLECLSRSAADLLQLILGAVVLYGGLERGAAADAAHRALGQPQLLRQRPVRRVAERDVRRVGAAADLPVLPAAADAQQIRCALIVLFTTTSATRAYSACEGQRSRHLAAGRDRDAGRDADDGGRPPVPAAAVAGRAASACVRRADGDRHRADRDVAAAAAASRLMSRGTRRVEPPCSRRSIRTRRIRVECSRPCHRRAPIHPAISTSRFMSSADARSIASRCR